MTDTHRFGPFTRQSIAQSWFIYKGDGSFPASIDFLSLLTQLLYLQIILRGGIYIGKETWNLDQLSDNGGGRQGAAQVAFLRHGIFPRWPAKTDDRHRKRL